MTPDDAALIMQLRAQGQTWRQVAVELGCAPVTLWRWRRRGLLADVDGMTLKQRAIVAEYDEPLADVITVFRDMGYDWQTIAGAMGVSMRQLVEWRRALGLPLNQNDKRRMA